MEHKSVHQLKQVADFDRKQPDHEPLSQRDRLLRWAWLLERQQWRSLNTFSGTERCTMEVRNRMRRVDSAISVAFQDPLLRREGLADDTYGTAKAFFGLSDHQLHNIVCDCHYGARMTARYAAWLVRATIPRPPLRSYLGQAWQRLVGR